MSMKARKIGISMVSFVLFGLGIALQIKSNIGQSMLNALALTLADVINIKIGTVLNILNTLFWCGNIAMRKFKMDLSDLVQIVAVLLNGVIINFFVYTVFESLVITQYALQVATFVIGLSLASISLGMLLAIGLIKFPMEGFCISLSKLLNTTLTKVRFALDVVFSAAIILMVVFTGVPLYMREGTVISFFLLSYLLGKAYTRFSKLGSLQ